MVVPGIAGLIGFTIINVLSQSEQTIDYLGLIVDFLLFISAVYTAMTTISARHSEDEKPKKHQSLPNMLSVREAANYLDVDEIDIRNLIEDGDLRAKAVGNDDYRISKEALEPFLNP